MTTENYLDHSKRAYQTGLMYGKLVALRADLNMGNNKEAIAKASEILKYMETEIVPEFYKQIQEATETETTYEEICYRMVAEIDLLRKLELEPGTPVFEYQQNMIKAADEYLKSKEADNESGTS